MWQACKKFCSMFVYTKLHNILQVNAIYTFMYYSVLSILATLDCCKNSNVATTIIVQENFLFSTNCCNNGKRIRCQWLLCLVSKMLYLGLQCSNLKYIVIHHADAWQTTRYCRFLNLTVKFIPMDRAIFGSIINLYSVYFYTSMKNSSCLSEMAMKKKTFTFLTLTENTQILNRLDKSVCPKRFSQLINKSTISHISKNETEFQKTWSKHFGVRETKTFTAARRLEEICINVFF